MGVMERDPQTFLIYMENCPDPELDEIYQTVATRIVCATKSGLLEIALRQNLSDDWVEKCNRYSLRVPCCLVFHARYLN